MQGIKRRIALFVLGATFSFGIVLPLKASSAARTFSQLSCPYDVSYGIYKCALVNDTTLSHSRLQYAYFDSYNYMSSYVAAYVELRRTSYTGSTVMDYAHPMQRPGNNDLALQIVNVKTNTSQWDFLEAYFNGTSYPYGVSLSYL